MGKETKKEVKGKVIQLRFEDNNLARNLFGPHDTHLKSIGAKVGVDIHVRGGELSIRGQTGKIRFVEKVLTQLYSLMKQGHPVMGEDVEKAVKILSDDRDASLHEIFLDSIFIPAKKRVIFPRSLGQKLYVESMRKYELVLGIGPAGTGKTYLAMAMAVTSYLKGEFKRIILTRPAIEAGEKLGFLPGNLIEKVNPYLRPLYDAMHDMLDFDQTQKMLDRGEIEVAPLAFMRGRTLNDAFVILDEAQNCTLEQMKMFLTRIGFQSKVVVTGDITQIDLPNDKRSGLVHVAQLLKDIPGIHIEYLSDEDVVRHPLVRKIIKAYALDEKGRNNKGENQ